MTIGSQFIFVGCTEGIIRCFNPETLQFITTLPRTHYLGVDVALGNNIRLHYFCCVICSYKQFLLLN